MSADRICVLYVDDDPAVLELAEATLERAGFEVRTAPDAEAALRSLDDGVDCVVSDYDMPGRDGLEFLDAIREHDPGLPFILCTAKGSEGLASEAIARGVTDYVRKRGTDNEVLANRIENAVDRRRTEIELREVERHRSLLVEQSPLGIVEWDTEFRVRSWNPAAAEIFGYDAEEARGRGMRFIVPDHERDHVDAVREALIAGEGGSHSVNDNLTRDGSRITCEWHNTTLVDRNGSVVGAVSFVQDVTDRRALREAVREGKAKIEGLSDSAAELARLDALEDVYRHTVRSAADVLEFEFCYLGIEDDGWIEPVAISPEADPDAAEAKRVDEGIVGETYRTGESYLIEDVAASPDAAPSSPEYRSAISVPVGDVGVFQAIALERGAFDRTDLELAELLIAYATEALVRIRSERALREERDRFAALFENVPDPAVSYRYEDDRPVVEGVNAAFTAAFGYDADEAIDRPVDELIVPDDHADEARALNEQVRAGEPLDCEVERETVDGLKPFLLRNVPLHTEDGLRGYAIYTDIAELRERERELERYATLVEAAGDPMYATDEEGYVTLANRAMCEVVGLSREEIVGTHASAFTTGEGVERAQAAIDMLLNDDGREWATFELEVIDGDGKRRLLEDHVALLPHDDGFRGSVGVFRDVTERTRHQETLAALQRTTRTMIGCETKTGMAEHVIDACQDVLELPYGAVLRHDSDDRVLRPIAITDTWSDLRAEVDEHLTFEEGESLTWAAFADGETRTYDDITDEPGVGRSAPKIRSLMLFPLGDHGIFAVGSTETAAFDETDRDFASILAASLEAGLDRADRELQLRERERELERQNERLEAFASVVSHDLRSPLNVAKGRLDLAEGDPDPEHFDHARRALDRMEAIIQDVLALAREGDLEERETVDVEACLRIAWSNVDTGGAALDVSSDLGRVVADRSRLQRAFENLFRNAVEHGSTSPHPQARANAADQSSTSSNSRAREDAVEHGPTSPRSKTREDAAEQSSASPRSQTHGDAAERDDPDVTVRVGDLDGGYYVEDDGPGLPAEGRDRIFEYGHSSAGGTGLGLAIVEGIVDAHGWEIRATDASDGGARFEITGVENEPSD